MPLNYKEYHPKWTLIRRLILKRENNCCKHCGVQNHAIIQRGTGSEYRYADPAELSEYTSRVEEGQKPWAALRYMGLTKVILTIAHLDRHKENNRFWNLAALCQRCHLVHDKDQHQDNKKYGRKHKAGHQAKLEL